MCKNERAKAHLHLYLQGADAARWAAQKIAQAQPKNSGKRPAYTRDERLEQVYARKSETYELKESLYEFKCICSADLKAILLKETYSHIVKGYTNVDKFIPVGF